MKEYAPAKINLFLDVIRKREDGYHDLGTLFQTIDAGDTVSAEPRQDGRITLCYNEPQNYPLESDLVYKAAKLLQQESGTTLGADIYLNKVMPLGAGLGGGSADAAATLRLLNQLWKLKFKFEKLEANVGEKVYDGTTSIDEVNEHVGVNLPEDEYDTIGGFVISLLGYLPQDGEMNELDYENLHFTILNLEDKRIGKLKVEIRPVEKEEDEEEEDFDAFEEDDDLNAVTGKGAERNYVPLSFEGAPEAEEAPVKDVTLNDMESVEEFFDEEDDELADDTPIEEE